MDNQNKTETLKDRQMRRLYAFYQFTDFIDSWDIKCGKGARYRAKLRCFLRICSTREFETEEEEYQTIQKYGEGIWDIHLIPKAFTDREIAECILPLARLYGALDY